MLSILPEVSLSQFRGRPTILAFYPADFSPSISDFERKGAVAKKYGVYRKQDSMAERALFVIDGNGIIHWCYISPIGVNPGAEGILKSLESMNSKQDK